MIPCSSMAESSPGEPSPLLREEMYRRYLDFPSRVRGGTVEPHWLPDGSRFWYAAGAPDRTVIYRVAPEAATREPLFDTERLRRALTRALGHEPPYRGLPFESFRFSDGEEAVDFTVEGRRFRLDLTAYTLTPLPALSETEEDRFTPRVIRQALFPGFPPVREILSPDRRWFLTAKEGDLWLRSTADGRLQPLTDDATADFDWKVQQDELWSRAAWSPDGSHLVAIKEDRRGVERTPVVHWLKPTAEVEWVPLTKAGGALPRTELWLIDRYTRRRVKIDTGPPRDPYFPYFHLVGWLPDESEVLVLAASRDFKRLRLLAAAPATGATRKILEEIQPTFIKNLSRNPEWTELATLLPASRRLIWISERDGWDHLYLYDLQGELLRRLTAGAFPVIRVVAVDEERGWVYFTAHAEAERIYDTHLYRVGLDGRGFHRLTEAPGQHQVAFSPSMAFFLDAHSAVDRPPRVELRSADGRLLQTLETADVSALEELAWRPPEPFVAKAADGETDLYGLLYKPWDFDPEKSYPVIEHLYGGPFQVYVPRTFTAGRLHTFAQAMAQLGYVVVTVDARGTPERGKAFQDVVYGAFGRHEMPDHVAVLRQLGARRPYMDLDRVGVFGGSWGGYMTVRALLTAPEVYHAGVATNPVYDFFDHGATGLEGYLGLPQDHLEAYEQGSNLRLAHRLEGELLLIHGTSDVNATFSATMKMADALIRAGKFFDLIVLPEQDHHYQGYAWDYRLEAHRRFFARHLKP